MNSCRVNLLGLLFVGLLFSLGATAVSGQTSDEIFKGIKLIELNTMCGSVCVNRWSSDEVKVSVINECSPREACDTKVHRRDSTLYIEERIVGFSRGCTHWTLTVPDNIEMRFKSTSGNVEISDLDCVITGVSTSGSFEIKNCRGIFKTASTSGDVEVHNIILEASSSFTSTSGDVEVKLDESSHYDLNVGSTSGKAVLDYNGNPFVGQFELTAKNRSGKIVCSEDFDNVNNYEKMGQRYVMKSFVKQSRDPLIQLGTSSGKVVLK